MSTIVLLNNDGTFRKKVHLTSLPVDYKVPAGSKISWRFEIDDSYRISMYVDERRVPMEAHFFRGTTTGLIEVIQMSPKHAMDHSHVRRKLRVTVQGTNPVEINGLALGLLKLVQDDMATWEVYNDLNPKPKKLSGFKKFLKLLKKGVDPRVENNPSMVRI